ncbi:hypothetical protein IKB17_04905 [bacterium]|nr:hypothetical protein [bacterium]
MPLTNKKHVKWIKFHVKFLTKPKKFTKLNKNNMVEIHVKHGFEHVGQIQKNCYKTGLVHNMISDI